MQTWNQMRTLFPGNFRPSEAEIRELWEKATFVLDANVLLNVYRYSPLTKTTLTRVFSSLGERIWVPYQAALEFHRNRTKVISSQILAYESAIMSVRGLLESLKAPRSHPFVSETMMTRTSETTSSLECELKERLEAHEKLLSVDPDLDALAGLLDGHIGPEPTLDDQKKLIEMARARIELKLPPGYKDKKSEDRDLGDAIVWLQTMDYARTNKVPIVMITDDGKEDWWEIVRGRTLGPRPELVKEFLNETEQNIHMYQPSQFIKYAAEFLKLDVDAAAIKEAKSVTVERVAESRDTEPVSVIPTSRSLTTENLLEYLRTFSDRTRASRTEAMKLRRELQQLGYETIEEVQIAVSDGWAEFEKHEEARSNRGSGKFAQAGVVRVIVNRRFG